MEDTQYIPQTPRQELDKFEGFITYSPALARQWSEHIQASIQLLGYLARRTYLREANPVANYITITLNAPENGMRFLLK